MKTRNAVLSTLVLTVLLAVVPATALGQGRGRGHDHGRNQTWSTHNNKNYNKKCGKFVNCHDARDGRWDGRGPRGDRVGNSTRYRRYRNRNHDQNRWLTRRSRWLNR